VVYETSHCRMYPSGISPSRPPPTVHSPSSPGVRSKRSRPKRSTLLQVKMTLAHSKFIKKYDQFRLLFGHILLLYAYTSRDTFDVIRCLYGRSNTLAAALVHSRLSVVTISRILLSSPRKRGIMFLPVLVCLSVYLFVCYHDN